MSGRIRTVKPEWGEDEALVMTSSDARVLSVLMLLWADDHGNGRAGPEPMLAAMAFPRDPTCFKPALLELVAIGYAQLYNVDGQNYFSVRNWKKHQRVDKPSAPRVPVPPIRESVENPRETLANPRESVENPRETLATGGEPARDREAARSRLTPTPTPTSIPTSTERERETATETESAISQAMEADATEYDKRSEIQPPTPSTIQIPPQTDSLREITESQVDTKTANEIFTEYQSAREKRRQIAGAIFHNGTDIALCKTLYMLAGGDRVLLRHVIRAYLEQDGAKGYFKNQRWALRILAEPRNFDLCRSIAGERLLQKKSQLA